MTNYIQTIKTYAGELTTCLGYVNNTKSAKNNLTGAMLYTLLQGSIQDKAALSRFIGKGCEGEAFKSYASKARTIAAHVETGEDIELKDGAIVPCEVITQGSIDNIPQVTFSTLYAAINKVNKVEKEEESKESKALTLACEAENVSKETLKMLSEGDKASLVQQGLELLAQADASEARKVSIETFDNVKDAIATMTSDERLAIVDYIATLEEGVTVKEVA